MLRFVILMALFTLTNCDRMVEAATSECGRSIVAPLPNLNFLTDGNQILRLPARSVRYTIGTYVWVPGVGGVLGLAGLRFSHERIRNRLVKLFPGGVGIRHIWSGELKLQNDSDVPGTGKLRAANETSGEFVRYWKPAGNSNSVREFVHDIRDHRPEIWDRKPFKSTYDRSVVLNTLHLIPGMDSLRDGLSLLKRFDVAGKDEELRHFVLNRVTMFSTLRPEYVEDPTAIPATLHHQLATGFGYEAFRVYLDWLQNDGVHLELTRDLVFQMEKWRVGLTRDSDSWAPFVTALDRFAEAITEEQISTANDVDILLVRPDKESP